MHIKLFVASLAIFAFMALRAHAQQPQAPAAGEASPAGQTEEPIADAIHVNVLGQVNRQERMALPKGSGLLDAIAEAGGMTKFADAAKTTVIHKGAGAKPDTERVNFNAIRFGQAKDIVLRDGDTVVVGESALNF